MTVICAVGMYLQLHNTYLCVSVAQCYRQAGDFLQMSTMHKHVFGIAENADQKSEFSAP